MTTEDDFQKRLTRVPGDWHTRLVLADFLQDRDDPRAEGYRALGRLRKRPDRILIGGRHRRSWYWADAVVFGELFPEDLPADWYARLPEPPAADGFWPHAAVANTRREVEDAAAIAFSLLPAARRAELLATEVV